ncbi:hypothetical protein [Nesterenkonia sphaerica]|uniref:Uncharacterized protein n=1 Tax=Nesterenkonia sphaerica TaxID=1804988 RepID=A0A5R9AME1_9MICC|nr:hypothetical protein [Nesterenkonia sphaerica]TLP78977.1 hypothetical protein FEF27_03750 [Nesterenkonia sphaerica]
MTQTETVTAEPESPVDETASPEGDDEELPEDPDDEPGAEGEEPPEDGDVPPGGAERIPEGEFNDSVHGEETETFYSEEGSEVGAAGFAQDEGPLVVPAEPTADAETVGELGPLDAVELGGRERQDDTSSSWIEVVLAEGYGWVESGQIDRGAGLFFFGETQDITDEYLHEVPPTESSEALVESLAEQVTGPEEEMLDAEGDPAGPRWTLVSSPADYDEEFYRVDVTGYLDDSLAGERLFITLEESGAGYELGQLERTLICRRGVADEGLCL